MNIEDFEVWDCQLAFLPFIFDIGPFGTTGLKEIHADTVDVRSGIDYELKLKPKGRFEELRRQLYLLFEVPEELFVFEEQSPVALITVALSIGLAVDPQLRTQFLVCYDQQLPVITPFLFTLIGTGQLNSRIYIKQNILENAITHEMLVALFLSFSCFDPDISRNTVSFNGVLLWFLILNNQIHSVLCPYFSLVQSKRIPLAKTKLSPLYDLWIWDGKIWLQRTSVFERLTVSQQRMYALLAVVFNINFTKAGHSLCPMDYDYILFSNISEIWNTEELLVKEFIAFILNGVDAFYVL